MTIMVETGIWEVSETRTSDMGINRGGRRAAHTEAVFPQPSQGSETATF